MKYRLMALVAVCAAGATEAKADTFYLGVHGGAAFLNDNWTLNSSIPPYDTYSGTSSASGALAGVQVGWQHPFQHFTFGVEGDLSFTDLNAGFDGFEGIGVSASMLSSLRARIGLTNGPIMPFLTAGVGLGNLRYTEQGTWFGSKGDYVDTTRFGLVVGGGVDAKLNPQWTGRLEGLYYAFGGDSGTFADNYGYTVNPNVFVIRAGLSYNFGH